MSFYSKVRVTDVCGEILMIEFDCQLQYLAPSEELELKLEEFHLQQVR